MANFSGQRGRIGWRLSRFVPLLVALALLPTGLANCIGLKEGLPNNGGASGSGSGLSGVGGKDGSAGAGQAGASPGKGGAAGGGAGRGGSSATGGIFGTGLGGSFGGAAGRGGIGGTPPFGRGGSVSTGGAGLGGAPSLYVISSFQSPASRCEGLAWDGTNLWFLDNLYNIYKLDPNGTVLGTFATNLYPQDLAWDGSGLWMGAPSGLIEVDATGKQIASLPGLYYWDKSGFAWDGKNFWVGDYNAGDIYKYTADGKLILNWSAGFFGHPTGISSDGQGLWIGGSGEGTDNLFYYSLTGQLLASYDPELLGITAGAGSFSCVEWDGSAVWYAPDSQFTIYRLGLTNEGSCTLGMHRCAQNIPESCSPSGTWMPSAACPYGCSQGNCLPKPSVDAGADAPPTLSIVSSFTSPASRCEGLAWDGQHLWFLDNLHNVFELDRTGNVLGQFSSSLYPSELSWGGGGLWMGTGSGIVEVDATGAEIDHRSSLVSSRSGFAWTSQNLWVADANLGTIYKYTPDGTLILNWNSNIIGHPSGMATDGQGLWIGGSGEDPFANLYYFTFLGQLVNQFDPRKLGIASPAGSFSCVEWDGTNLWYSPDSQFTIYQLQVTP